MASLDIRHSCASAEVLRASQGSFQRKSAQRARTAVLTASTWNVRSMVDTVGPVDIASCGQRGEDRKIDQIVLELMRFNVVLGALQETKWFGDNVYEVLGSIVLNAGRPSPVEGAVVQRGEGVALVLMGPALAAWKRGGKQWKAWSSRCVSARLEFSNRRLHVMSCYAPTRAASREEKDNFFNQLNAFMLSIPAGEHYVILGDFNAQVGSRTNRNDDDDSDIWDGVLGPHGYGTVNDAGKELLSFLSCHQATICNTYFKKKDAHKQTWQHPRSKKWHCIDFVVVDQQNRRYCTDVTVQRRAFCNTDHHLVCAKFCFEKTYHRRTFRRGNHRVKRYDVSKLNHQDSSSVRYLETVVQRFNNSWSEDGTLEEKWQSVRDALTSAANDVLGFSSHRQADWFSDSLEHLQPLLMYRNEAYNNWINTGKYDDLIAFKKARGEARRAVKETKNRWFQEKAATVEQGQFGGKLVWNCIRDMQRGRRGRVPSRVITIHDENNVPCVSTASQHQRWRHHFTKVLNVVSEYDESELDLVRQREVDPSLACLPCEYDVQLALSQVKSGKAAGKSGILPEMVKIGQTSSDFVHMLLKLVQAAWKEKRVPRDWQDAILVPIPKKGNLHCCDNWRGIALLDVVGKLVGRIVQNRLQKFAELVLPESQCGFRRGRSCTDMIFMVRQLAEKAIEHNSKQYFVFVDLRKAYDSVPRAALWVALEKLGVPKELVELVKSFHDDTRAEVRVDGELLQSIEVKNGLRQGCTMAPTLFNIYASVVAERWLSRIETSDGVGTLVVNKQDGLLFRRSTKHSSGTMLYKGEFADDVVLLARSRDAACVAVKAYVEVAKSLGLTVSFPKTKFMVVGSSVTVDEQRPLAVGDDFIEWVDQFPYLGSIIADKGDIDADVDRRIASASKAFGALRRTVFTDHQLSLKTKRYVYQACVLSTLLYGSECWTPLRRHLRRLESFNHRCIKTMLAITNRQQWQEHITSANIRRQWGDTETIATKLRKHRLEWLGHVARMNDHRLPRVCLFGWLPQVRPFHGPKRRWRDVLKSDLRSLGISDGGWYDRARDREQWQQLYLQSVDDGEYLHTAQLPTVQCAICQRFFRSESGKARHKCVAERQLPIEEQTGAVQCQRCERWFRSAGGLAVHKCETIENYTQASIPPEQSVFCNDCSRSFSRPGDLKRHKCLAERAKPISEQHGAVQCQHCRRWMKSVGGLKIHLKKCIPQE